MSEIWAKLYCCEEIEVSNLGRARRLDRLLIDGRKYKGSEIPICYKHKYIRFAYTYKGVRKFISMHRAVYFSFSGKPIPRESRKIVVDHIDEDKHNNRLENLQLISQSSNVIKSLKTNENRKPQH